MKYGEDPESISPGLESVPQVNKPVSQSVKSKGPHVRILPVRTGS